MSSEPGQSARRLPLEALILAFSCSRARELVGTDALRSVLGGQYRDLVKGGSFDLEPVWQLLAEQPGFSPDAVMPPLARFKSWQPRLGLTVSLPAAMADLSEGRLAELAGEVQVRAADQARVWRGLPDAEQQKATPGADRRADADARSVAGRSRSPRQTAGRAGDTADLPLPSVPVTQKSAQLNRPHPRRRIKLSPRQRRVIEIAAVVLGIGGFAVAGGSLYRSCHSPSWESVSLSFSGEIPLARATRLGPEVGATVQDEAWFARPDSERRAQMQSALEHLPGDVQAFFVRDTHGRVRAAARRFGHPRHISVTLR